MINPGERNQTRLTCGASDMWQSMTTEQKAPWDGLAERAKAKHEEAFPNYRFTPENGSLVPAPSTPRRIPSRRTRGKTVDDDDYAHSTRSSRRRKPTPRKNAPYPTPSSSLAATSSIANSNAPTSPPEPASSQSSGPLSLTDGYSNPLPELFVDYTSREAYDASLAQLSFLDFLPPDSPVTSGSNADSMDDFAYAYLNKTSAYIPYHAPSAPFFTGRRSSSCPPPGTEIIWPTPALVEAHDAYGSLVYTLPRIYSTATDGTAPQLNTSVDLELFGRRPSVAGRDCWMGQSARRSVLGYDEGGQPISRFAQRAQQGGHHRIAEGSGIHLGTMAPGVTTTHEAARYTLHESFGLPMPNFTNPFSSSTSEFDIPLEFGTLPLADHGTPPTQRGALNGTDPLAMPFGDDPFQQYLDLEAIEEVFC